MVVVEFVAWWWLCLCVVVVVLVRGGGCACGVVVVVLVVSVCLVLAFLDWLRRHLLSPRLLDSQNLAWS